MFAAPLFLWGLAAVSVPVIIHLMQSPRARVIDFPTIRFLKACQRRATRRTRLKNIILMLMRMALIALVALGMAKPQRQREQTQALPDAPLSMVIVLDNSYSMGYLDRGKSRFERAKEAAIALVETMKEGDEAAVVLANEGVEPLVREFTNDREKIKKAIRSAKLSFLGTNLDPAVREAVRLAGRAGAAAAKAKTEGPLSPELLRREAERQKRRRREIHILTDLQASGWTSLLKSNFLKTAETDATFFITNLGRKGSPNAFIESVSASGGGPERCAVAAKVRAVGAGEPGNFITLSVNGHTVAQETFSVRPGAPALVELSARLPGAGTYRCELTLQEDDLTADDHYYFTIKVGERSAVLVVDGDPSAIPTLSETFFLANALNPGGVVTTEGAAGYETQVITPAELASQKLDDYRTVVLCNVPHLDGSDLVRLENYLLEGGTVLIFLGDKVDATHYNSWRFLPLALTRIEGDPSKKRSFGFAELRGDHPLFKKRKLDVRSARFFLCYGSDRGTLKEKSRVVASFANGQPALVEGEYGKGKVLLFTSTCDLDWGNFPLRRVFLPFVHQLVGYLSSQDVQVASFRLGDEVKFQATASHYTSRIVVTDPSGRRIVLPQPRRVGGYAEAVFTDTKLPGMYLVDADSAFTNSGGFGVNLRVEESVLTMADPEKIKAAGPPGRIRFIEGPARRVVEEVKKTREPEKIWPLLFQLALLVFIIESLFGNYVSRAKRAEGARFPLFEVLKQRSPGVA